MSKHIGYVVDINDPTLQNRVKVRIPSIHTDNIQDYELLWCLVGLPTTSSTSGGKGHTHELFNGSVVYGFFADGDDKQQFIVEGTIGGIPNNRSLDPDGRHPQFVNEPDVNRLARVQRVSETSIGEINNNRISFDNVNKITYTEESSKYNAKYPHNKVYESEAGHIVEFDSTPNNTRHHTRDPSGNYFESDHKGNTARKTYGVHRAYYMKDHIEYVKGNKIETIDGNYHIRVKGNVIWEIDGNESTWIKKSKEELIDGSSILFVKKTKEDVIKERYSIWARPIDLNNWKRQRPNPSRG